MGLIFPVRNQFGKCHCLLISIKFEWKKADDGFSYRKSSSEANQMTNKTSQKIHDKLVAHFLLFLCSRSILIRLEMHYESGGKGFKIRIQTYCNIN